MNFIDDLEQLQKLNLVLDSHAIVSVADVSGDIIYANDKFCEINEISREKLLGKNHNIVASGYHSKEFFEDLWDTITNGRVWHGEICNRSYLGKIYWVAATIMPFLDDHGLPYQYISIRTEITKQKQLEEELSSERYFFSSTMEHLGEGIIVINKDRKCTYLNPAAQETLGWNQEELSTRIVHEAIGLFAIKNGKRQSIACPMCMSQATGEEIRMDESSGLMFTHRNGDEFPVSLVVRPLKEEDGTNGCVAVFRNISKLKEFEKGIIEAKLAAEKSSQARSSFLANMSHEIRTPMNAIIGFTDILLKTDVNNQQLKHLSTIQRSAKSLLHLINDILDLSKLENKDNMSILNETFNLKTLCSDVIDTLKINAKRQNIKLELDYPDNWHEYWLGDQYRLQQILINLVGNAVKFTHKGWVKLIVSGSTKNLQIEISDTGIGIDEETLKNIFNPFAQADASKTRRYGGTGLGTTISKQIAEIMGGSLTASSKLGIGSVFTVKLPLEVSSKSNLTNINLCQNIDFKIPSLKVLAVDDIATNTELLEIILSDKGHKVTSVSSGQQAIDILQKEKFDLVFMDIQMPDMDGLEATRIIREIEHANNSESIPIIALSASVLPQDKHQAYDAGMNGFANKPIELVALFSEVAKVLNCDNIAKDTSNIDLAAIQTDNNIVDYDSALKLWRTPDNLHKAIVRFLNNTATDLKDLKAAYDAKNLIEMSAIGHKISGASSNLGLSKIRYWSSNIEKNLKLKSLKNIDKMVTGLEAAVVEALHFMHNQIKTNTNSNENNNIKHMSAAELSDVKNALNNLKESIKNYEILENELSLLKKHINIECVVELEDSLENFDFELAGKYLIDIENFISDNYSN